MGRKILEWIDRYAVVELSGNRTMLGRISETTEFGQTFVQIETLDKHGSTRGTGTICYHPSAIVSFRWVSQSEAHDLALGVTKLPSLTGDYCDAALPRTAG